MRYRLLSVLACGVLLLHPRAVAAQDTPRFGVTMGFPAAIGILWNVSNRVALRPTIDWSRSSSEASTTTSITALPPGIATITTTATATTSLWTVGAGVSALVYLSKSDALRTYVAPGFQYSRGSTSIDEALSGPTGPTQLATPSTSVSSNYTTSGLFGAQYTLGRRFGVFGELGVNYVHSGGTPNLSSGAFTEREASSWSVALRSGVGIILFF